MEMKVVRDTCSGMPTQICTDVHSVWLQNLLRNGDGALKHVHDGRCDHRIECGKVTRMHPRCNEEVTCVVRVPIEQDDTMLEGADDK